MIVLIVEETTMHLQLAVNDCFLVKYKNKWTVIFHFIAIFDVLDN